MTEAGKRLNETLTTENLAMEFLFNGDCSLEYGGNFVDLSEWKNGYADAVRVIDLDSGTGFRGACLIEHVTVNLGRPASDVKRAGESCGSYKTRRMPGESPEACKLRIRHAVAVALLEYGCYDPAQPYHYWDDFPLSETVQLEADGPMENDGWKADKRLHNTTLEAYVKSVHLRRYN